ncbi:hypothetical protein [Oceanithermus sp.]
MGEDGFKVKALEIAYTVAKVELGMRTNQPEKVVVVGNTPEERRARADELIKRTRELLDILLGH